eukprot:TRINITY_DN24096_c0_g1_i1.p2 TRINITY_DN24096_c0_g1~~TRINITY_DN24096_c0_g1_i1.p2  ORF type:complete len:168 (-),score=19.62 TRINITY_DN24096_c0_g1_i1:194-697(-)
MKHSSLASGLLERISFNMGLFTSLGPSNLLARNDVSKTNKARNTKPSADASNQFLPSEHFLPWKMLARLYCSFVVYCNNTNAPISSIVSIRSRDTASVCGSRTGWCSISAMTDSPPKLRGMCILKKYAAIVLHVLPFSHGVSEERTEKPSKNLSKRSLEVQQVLKLE